VLLRPEFFFFTFSPEITFHLVNTGDKKIK